MRSNMIDPRLCYQRKSKRIESANASFEWWMISLAAKDDRDEVEFDPDVTLTESMFRDQRGNGPGPSPLFSSSGLREMSEGSDSIMPSLADEASGTGLGPKISPLLRKFQIAPSKGSKVPHPTPPQRSPTVSKEFAGIVLQARNESLNDYVAPVQPTGVISPTAEKDTRKKLSGPYNPVEPKQDKLAGSQTDIVSPRPLTKPRLAKMKGFEIPSRRNRARRRICGRKKNQPR
ncbi:hypothetical protein BT69DRAFT_282127 [Atractiella rhizophila]|nr:hypothetical protein BT69DRAFT_282127 [Atractiella rhizophila]